MAGNTESSSLLGLEENLVEPYVGPRSFQKDQRGFFFGRDEEADELVSLITAHPVVLLYSQSGAGKTSLLNANLIPRLEESEHFNVLPPMRVQGQIPATLKIPKKTNIFVMNALMSCCKAESDRFKAGMTFHEFLEGSEKKTNQYGEPAPTVIIFDQFEELFTSYPGRWPDRADFFAQLGEALEGNPKKGVQGNPLLRVLFCMREDFIAELDPYVSLVPEKLRTRFRMEHLREQKALSAIKKPLEKTNRTYAKGVAEQLVKNLLKIPSQSMTGTQTTGLYVEPVQLQVVCQSLWEALTPDETVILKKHLDKYGDVSQALSKFYERSLSSVSKETGVKEEALRRWFADVLITSEGTRAPVNRGQDTTERMPNAAVDKLEEMRLIKGEWKGTNVRWYELAHDRFIEPIRRSNEKWLANQSRGEQIRLRLEAKALKWKQGGPLLEADELLEARRLLKANQASRSLQTLIDASRATAQRERIRRLKFAGVGLGVLALIGLGLALYAFSQRRAARAAEGLAKSRLLAFKARMSLAVDPELSVLLAKAAMDQFGDTKEARDVIRIGLLSLSNVGGALRDQGAKVTSAEFSNDGRFVLTTSADGKVRLWDAASKNIVKEINENGWVNHSTFSPDGKLIATAENEGLARVWDGTNGTPLKVLKGHVGPVNKVVFSADGKYIGTAGDDTTARIWNATTGDPIRVLHGHEQRVSDITFSADGTQVATEASDSTGRVWNLKSNKVIKLIGLTGPKSALAFSPDGKLLATEGGPGTEFGAFEEEDYPVTVWDLATEKPKFTLTGHKEYIAGVVFSPDGGSIVTSSGDGTARLWAADGKLKGELRGHTKSLSSAFFSPDGKFVVTTSADKTVRVWDALDGTNVDELRGHSQAVNSAAFSSNGEFLVTASDDQTVRLWPFRRNEVSTKVTVGSLSHSAGVNSGTFSPSGFDVVTTSLDGRLWLNAVGEYKSLPIAFMVGSYQRAADVAFSPDGQFIATTSNQVALVFKVAEVRAAADRIRFRLAYEQETLRPGETMQRVIVTKPELELKGHTGDVSTVAFSPDGSLILTASADGTARVWNAGTGAPVGHLVADGKKLNSACFSPDGKLILTAGGDATVRIWDAGKFSFVKNIGEHSGEVHSARYSPDGNLIVTASGSSAQVWDAKTGKRKCELKHKGDVNNAAFSPDSSLIVTANADKTASVWDAKTGDNIAVLQGHTGQILKAVFSPDGQSILTASEDQTARIYPREAFAPFEELNHLIEQRVARKLTAEEIEGYLHESDEHVVSARASG